MTVSKAIDVAAVGDWPEPALDLRVTIRFPEFSQDLEKNGPCWLLSFRKSALSQQEDAQKQTMPSSTPRRRLVLPGGRLTLL